MKNKFEVIDDDLVGNIQSVNFAVYNTFFSSEDIEEFTGILEENEIDYVIEKPQLILDKVIVGDPLMPYGLVRLHTSDFNRVNYLLVDHFSNMNKQELESHFLNQFNDEELEAIVVEDNEEWDRMNRAAAKAILLSRGKLSNKNISEMEKQNLINEYKGKSGNRIFMLIYALCFLIQNLLSVVAALGMAYYYSFGKRTATNGESVYVYDLETRRLGRIIFGMGIIILSMVLYFITTGENRFSVPSFSY